ncbi:alanine racemase [Paenisporosarcina quisquiliarum]|uniref:Alanine racemase n=1 Tax=Paenisporosarcina quisquiliarum TaxID=365346 RepID=A0A9X3RCF0_9BACL|nr:alanine racemase [Paenisporosarcina quisquiliarum]MCZ8536700.1 alanine racemase [Paenisporosarcina quisquiliarum]
MQPANFYRPTFAQIDLNALQMNILNLKKHIGPAVDVIAVVKANAYGHGDFEVSTAAVKAGASMLAVATPDEAIRLRASGIESPILVMGASPPSFAVTASQNDIMLTVFQTDWFLHIPALPNMLKIHIKIDTGMGRLGVTTESELSTLIQTINHRQDVVIDGVFTHFATADDEDVVQYTSQLEKFKTFLHCFPERPRCIHTANSAAALMHKESLFDAVRYGISMYGLSPSAYVDQGLPFPLERVMSLHTEVVHVKKVPAGSSISYGATYTADEDEWIATLPIGYADGMLRGLSGQEVLIQGKRLPVIGRICMDQCMVRLNGHVSIGEPVVLIGRQGNEQVNIEEWAQKLQTISYEIPCVLTNRVPRTYTP